MTSRAISLVLLLAAGSGCSPDWTTAEAREESTAETAGVRLAADFDPNSAGRIEGRVVWSGDTPVASPFVFGVAKGPGDFATELIPNPNLPKVDPETRGVAGVVLSLQDLDPRRAKPWDHPPVAVQVEGRAIRVRQGNLPPRRVGFVRRGSELMLTSQEPGFQIIRGRGAAFFSYTFPEPNKPINRRLEKNGIVEISHGAGYYWARAYLFVDEHPYHTVTDQAGRFELEQVPPGEYELTAWLPDWGTEKLERDPESGLVARLRYGAPTTVLERVAVKPKASTSVKLSIPGELKSR